MFQFRLSLYFSLSLLLYSGLLSGQTPSPSLGEITVQLIQGLDSATNPRGISEGKVTKSTNPAVPVGTTATMGLGSDPVNGGYSVKLLRLSINGQMVPAASSDVVGAPDFFNKMQEKIRAKGQPQDAASGTRVFLPEKMIVRFTLATPSAEAASAQRQRPERTQTLPPPKAWKIDKLPEINSAGQDVVQTAAILEGHSTIRGRTSESYLVMHCGFPTTEYPGLLPLEVILGGTDAILDTPGAPGMPLDVSAESSSQIGVTSPIHVNASGQNRTTGARVRFFYDAPDMNSIVDAVGQPLKLSIGSGTPAIEVSFTLPADNAALKQMMNTCLQKSVADAQAAQAVMVAACPSKEGKTLTQVELKYVDTGKDVKGDMDEEDNGGVWKLPPANKGRAPRKTILTCSYRDAKKEDGSAVVDTATVPVPVTARTCSFTVHENELHNDASCVSAAPKSRIPNEFAAAGVSSPSASSGPSQRAPGTTVSSGSDLLAGPVGPVNRLNVRGMSVRMGRAQIIAAAKAAGMIISSNTSGGLEVDDPTVFATSGLRSGLFLKVVLKNDTAVRIIIGEQGASKGEIFEDLSKKWGKPTSLPYGWNNQLGAPGEKASWGDKKLIYAEYDPSISSFTGQTVIISDAVALAPHTQPRKSVPM